VSESGQLSHVLIILLAAVAVVSVFRRLQASAVLGYLVAGALIGPFGLGLVENTGITSVLAQFGVVFLLFSIGLELSLERLLALRRYVFGVGAAQVVGTTLVFSGALAALGTSTGAALILGAGFALSSTAVVLHMLVERREIASSRGRVAFAVLLFQDLAVVPLLALIPLLGRPGATITTALGGAFLKATAAILLILAIGRLIVRPALRTVARGRAPELFTGVVLLLVLGIGWLTEQGGLSMALGAFLAGVLIAETEYRPQVEGDIQPFRGILLALFFMTVGMGLDLTLLQDRWPSLLALVAVLLTVKAGILVGAGRLFGLPSAIAVGVGLILAQGGEFGFVLFSLAHDAGVIPAETTQLAMLVVGLSMAVTPLLLIAARAISHRVGPALPDDHFQDAARLENHVVIAGFGRVGQTLGSLLESAYIPYVALDLDSEQVAKARYRGLPVFFGDASQVEVLKAAAVERAQAVVITLDEPLSANKTVHVLRHLLPDIPILARARDVAQGEKLAMAGASRVVPEMVEGSLQLGGVLLQTVGKSPEEVNDSLEQFRRQTYSRLGQVSTAP
jgi:CPA2 family monovalent cation:H+ antiporter-2